MPVMLVPVTAVQEPQDSMRNHQLPVWFEMVRSTDRSAVSTVAVSEADCASKRRGGGVN